MSIGARLQKARIAACLTQEQAAERLQVSRQTISNWENDKTLPDVSYAKDISLAYAVSLDELISGAAMSVTTDDVSEKIADQTELGKACLGIYLFLWVGSLLFFWIFGTGGGFAMFYAIFVYGILFHAGSGLVAFLFGLFDCWPMNRLQLVLLFGIGQMLLPWLTYSLCNTFTSGNINPLSWEAFVSGIVIGAVCMALGRFVSWITDKFANVMGKFFK